MADGNTPVAGTGDGQPELVDVVFNNQTVRVTKAHAAVLQEAERSLKQASQQKFEDAAREHKEAERISGLMEEDAIWLNAHDSSEYKSYELKSRGGRGYVGTEATVNPAMSGDMYNPDGDTKHNAEIDSLKAEMKELKTMLTGVVEKDNKQSVATALETKNDLLKKHNIKPGSTVDDVMTKQLKAFHADNNRAPSPKEVNELVQQVVSIMGKAEPSPIPPRKTDTGGTPSAGGTAPPATSTATKLDFSGPDGLKRLADDMANQLSGIPKK